jgi:hypothetical protein
LAEITKPILKILNKDAKFELCDGGNKSFNTIKDSIARYPMLISLDYSKDFHILSFALEDTIEK